MPCGSIKAEGSSSPKLSEDFLASPSIKLFMSLQTSVLRALTLSSPAADLVVTSWGSLSSSVNVSQCAGLGWVCPTAVLGGVGGACLGAGRNGTQGKPKRL